MRARACAAILTSLAMAVLGPSATADERVVADGDDSTSAIDVEKVRQGHYFEYVLYRVTAFEPWEPADLEGGRMVFRFDLDDDPAIERRGIVEYVGGGGSQLRSTVVDRRGNRIGRAVHRRPNGRSVELWFRRSQLKHAKTYRVFVTVETSASDACADEPCVDRAPDAGSMRHRLHELCSGREPTITGTRGDDELRATRRADVIAGRGGDDEIVGVSDSDVVCGGPGDDLISGGRGFLFLRGGPGADRISATGPRPRPCDDTGGGSASCAYPEAVLLGGAGDDLLVGGRYHERLLAGRGDDELRGKRRSDVLEGGRGSDLGRGGGGDDACSGLEDRRSCP
jgi:hypothetical protein